jgi:hypothetical protein
MIGRLLRSGAILMLSLTGISELTAQSLFESAGSSDTEYSLSGFIRSYGFISRGTAQNYHFTSSVSDLSLQVDAGNTTNIKAFGELRYSYGSLNDVSISRLDLREAWIGFYPGRLSIEAGRKIVTWGRGDIFTPFSITPSDNLVRSPDSEDRMIANMLISSGYVVTDRVAVTAVVLPLYTPSVLPVNVIDLPPSVSFDSTRTIEHGDSFIAGYGFRSDFNFSFTDISLYWFEGYDLLPVILLAGYNLLPTEPDPLFTMTLQERGFLTRMVSADAEGTFSRAVWRAGISRTFPDKSSVHEGYLPFGQTSWMAGVDISAGKSTVTIEYGGAFIHNWHKSPVEPRLPGGEITDDLVSIPAEEIPALLNKQIIAFNRMYRYQTEQWYNMIGCTVTGSAAYGKLKYNTSMVFNITSSELLLRPTLEYMPYDRISFKIGLEYWWGKENSLYSYLSDNLTSLLITARISF